jgi:hypothetical protein
MNDLSKYLNHSSVNIGIDSFEKIGPSGLWIGAGYLAPDFRRLQSGLSQASPSGFQKINQDDLRDLTLRLNR